jgi:tRNA(Ile)-lysidine synthase
MVPDPALVDRFRADLDALSPPGERVGIAVSGGPDSLALLLLAAAARPGLIEAATVDHGLRAESRAEAEMVARVCAELGVAHDILVVEWSEPPSSAIQERGREARYRLLAGWLVERKLKALATAHHANDQAETMLMRLNRGSGLRGLAGMRPKSVVPGSRLPLLRPLLSWQRAELEQICAAGGIKPAVDPSNSDEQFERVRVRKALAEASWLSPEAMARSAEHLASADDALGWVAEGLALARVTDDAEGLKVDAVGLPAELQRRLLLTAFARFHAAQPKGADLMRAIDALSRGDTATLSGLKLDGGRVWRVSKAPPRRKGAPIADLQRTRPVDNLR